MVTYYIKKHTISFKYAFKGLFYALRTQPNFWVHLFWALAAFLSGVYFKISSLEWLVLVLTVSLVLVTEMLNTSLEIVTDALKVHKRTEQDDFYIMVGKDVAAGAVLVAAFFSVVIGLIIFGPKLLPLFLPQL